VTPEDTDMMQSPRRKGGYSLRVDHLREFIPKDPAALPLPSSFPSVARPSSSPAVFVTAPSTRCVAASYNLEPTSNVAPYESCFWRVLDSVGGRPWDLGVALLPCANNPASVGGAIIGAFDGDGAS
jgi:hypothetical protein